MSTSYSSMTFSSPLDPSAEDKAQETFARLYQEHVTTEEETKNSSCKIIHKKEEQSTSTEHFYESRKNKNAFHPLPSNIKTNNLVQGNAPNPQSNGSMSDPTDKKPRVTCTSKSSPNIFQSVSKEQTISHSEEKSSTITTNTSTDAFAKNTFQHKNVGDINTNTKTGSLVKNGKSTDPFVPQSKSSHDAFSKSSLYQQNGSTTTSKSSSSVSSICQESRCFFKMF